MPPEGSSRSRGLRRVVLALLAVAVTGCPGNGRYAELQRTIDEQQERVRALERELADRDQSIRNLREQVSELRGMDGDPLDLLVAPVKIELARQSGGYDRDGKAGDDGIVLYIQPIDRDGHVIKAAGSIRVVLYDLKKPPDHNLFQEYVFDEETTRSLWYGRMWTHHFTVRCPWPPTGPPEHDEITADVTFTDRLTGQVLRTQQMFRITLPPRPSDADADG